MHFLRSEGNLFGVPFSFLQHDMNENTFSFVMEDEDACFIKV
jgi:hypothetical protein